MDLFVHITVDNYQALQLALDKHSAEGTDLTKVLDPQGNTLMHICAQQRSLQCMQVLAKKVPGLVSQRNATTQVEPLHVAVGGGMLNCVHMLLSAGANPNSPCPDSVVGQMTALCGAVSKRNVPLVTLLLKAKANVDTLSLLTGVRFSDIGIVSLLLERCVASDNTSINGRLTKEEAGTLQLPRGHTALLGSIHLKFHDITPLLLQAGANIEMPDAQGRRPFHVAASRDDVQAMRMLLQRNVTVAATREKDAWGALHFAAEANAFQAATFLLMQLGFNVNQVANNLATPLHVACWNKCSSVVQALVMAKAVLDQEMDRGWTALAIACKNGDLLSVTTLLKARASVDSTDRSVPSPLLRAASSNFHQVASALLSAKAFVNKPNAQGVTPLFLAASRGNSESLRILLQHGAATDQEHSTTGITPLMQASAFKHIQCAQFLLQSKACPNKVAKNSMTALHLAIKNKNPAGISVLMRFKADANRPLPSPGASGVLTPLLACVMHEFAEGLMILHQHRADCNFRQAASGWTALHAAVSRGDEKCCRALLSRTDLFLRDASGQTPLDLARAGKNSTIVSYLENPQLHAVGLPQAAAPVFLAQQSQQAPLGHVRQLAAAASSQLVFQGPFPPQQAFGFNITAQQHGAQQHVTQRPLVQQGITQKQDIHQLKGMPASSPRVHPQSSPNLTFSIEKNGGGSASNNR